MDLRNFGDVVRNHYEKLVLTLVLLGLAFAVIFVYRASQRAEAEVDISLDEIISRKPKPVTPVDLSAATVALKAHQAPPAIDFSKPHNLVNPVKWKRRPTGELLKMANEEVGWDKMIITRLVPLTFRISLDKIPNPGGYFLGYQNEAAERFIDRKKFAPYLKLNETNKLVPRHIVLREIKGPLEKPEELVIEFIDTGEKISISSEKPFERIEGYEADLKHEFIPQPFNKLRVGSSLKFLDDDYIIVAINQSEVVASARATEKKYTVRQLAPGTNNLNRASSTPPSPEVRVTTGASEGRVTTSPTPAVPAPPPAPANPAAPQGQRPATP